MRLRYVHVLPNGYNTMLQLEKVAPESGLDPILLELVRIRASQLNGCAFCLDMHTKDARARGEAEQRLHLLAAWRDAPCFTARERAALAWCENVTNIADDGVPDDVYEAAATEFTPTELVSLTFAVIAINAWNRLNVAFQTPVGNYVSPHGSAPQEPR